jgi:hypothetical protein
MSFLVRKVFILPCGLRTVFNGKDWSCARNVRSRRNANIPFLFRQQLYRTVAQLAEIFMWLIKDRESYTIPCKARKGLQCKINLFLAG